MNALHRIDYWAQRFLIVPQVLLLVSLAVLAYYATDRKPPFTLLSVYPAEGRVGDVITIRADVRRETWRHCSVQMWRFAYDKDGDRAFVDYSEFSAKQIENLERRTPGRVGIVFRIPEGLDPGDSLLESNLKYRCNGNITHLVAPISVTTEIPFTILP